MKRTLGLLFGISLWLSLILGVIHLSSFDKTFYSDRYRELDVARNIGITETELMNATDVLLDYLSGARDNLNVTAVIDGEMSPVFNQREIDHMVDVQVLFVKTINLRNVLIGLGALMLALCAFLYRKEAIRILITGFKEASLVLGVLLTFLILYAALDFYGFWITFHKLLFTNDLWLLNPATDNLILMVPGPFFNALVGLILYRIVLGLGILYTLIHGLENNGYDHRALKVIAVVTMTIDHVGHFLFPSYFGLRVIGRIAFPIFTYLFALSYRYTHDRKAFAIRIAVTAVLGQALIYFAGATELVSIFFLFALGIAAFEALDRKMVWAIIPLALGAEFFHVDYGAYGILVLCTFYAFQGNFTKQALSFSGLTLLMVLSPFFDPSLWSMVPLILNQFFQFYWRYFVQALSVLALIPLAFYNPAKPVPFKEPLKAIERWFFYLYYPLHIALLALLRGGL